MTAKPTTEPNKPMHYAGYIALNGDLYSFPSGAHMWVAENLAMDKFSDDPLTARHPMQVLDKRGWLKVQSDGEVCIWKVESITQSQLDTLGDLLTCEHHTTPPVIIKDSPHNGDRYLNGTAEGWKEHIERTIYYFRDKVAL